MFRVDYEIQEGGMHPPSVLYHCPVNHEYDRQNCCCFAKCPTCGPIHWKHVVRKHLRWVYKNIEVAQLRCELCGGIIATYLVHMIGEY